MNQQQGFFQRPTMPGLSGGQAARTAGSGLDFTNWGALPLDQYDPEFLKQHFGEDMAYGVPSSQDPEAPLGQLDPIWNMSEQQRYETMGRADPRYQQALEGYASTSDKMDDLVAQHPELLGMLNFRSIEGTSPDAAWFQDPSTYWSATLQRDYLKNKNPELAAGLAQSLSKEQGGAGSKWNYEMSPAVQSQRNDPDELGGLGGLLSMGLYLIPGFQALAPWIQGAAIGGLGGALSGGDPLKGALLGGLGGWAGGEILGSSFAAENPVLGRALSSGARGLIGSGGDLEAGLGAALTGGLTQFGVGQGLDRGLASTLGSAGSSLLRGKQINPKSFAMNAALASLNSGGAQQARRPVYK